MTAPEAPEEPTRWRRLASWLWIRSAVIIIGLVLLGGALKGPIERRWFNDEPAEPKTGLLTFPCETGCDDADARRASTRIYLFCELGNYDQMRLIMVGPGGRQEMMLDCP